MVTQRQRGSAIGRLADELRRIIGDERGDQHRFAERLGVSRSSVSRWANGEVIPSYENVYKMGLLLKKVDVGHLLALQELAVLERERLADKGALASPDRPLESAGTSAGRTQLLATQDEVFSAAAIALETALTNRVEPRSLDWAAIHGVGGPREDDLDAVGGPPAAVRRFDKAIQRVLADRKHPWAVRQVFNIDSEAAYRRVMRRLQDREGCGADYDVWAYSVRDAPPVLCPLIVCSRWIFLAPEASRTYRAASGLFVDDGLAGTWARSYFEQLLANAPFRIRSAGGIDKRAITRLRDNLR